MAAAVNRWKDFESAVIAKLDIRAEYEALGLKFAKDWPTEKGWLDCYAAGRDDAKASAAVNVGEDPAVRGRYRDLGGEGLSLSLWDFAAKFGNIGGGDWRKARRILSEKTDVPAPNADPGEKPEARPADKLAFYALDSDAQCFLNTFVLNKKGGFDLETVVQNGGLPAEYPKKAPYARQTVATFPGFSGGGWADGEPCVWVIAAVTGDPVKVYQGKGKPFGEHKTLSVGGSTGGLMGRYALRKLKDKNDEVEVVWKVEGLTDMLTLHQAIRDAGLLGKHVVVSNTQGSLETVKPEWVEILRDKTLYVIQDCDRPGQTGAVRWCQKATGIAKVVKNVVLPFPIKDSHGEDTRDFLHRDKKTFADLLAIAEATPEYQPPAATLPITWPGQKPGGQVVNAVVGAAGNIDPITGVTGAGSPADPSGPMAGGIPARQAASDAERYHDDTLALLEMEVLGVAERRKILVYCRQVRSVRTIENIDNYSYRSLTMDARDLAAMYVTDGKDRSGNKRSMEDVRLAIAFKAGEVDLTEVGMMGQGIWKKNGLTILVNGKDAAVFDHSQAMLGRTTAARIDNHTILDYASSPPWVDIDEMNRHLADSADPAWCRKTLGEAQQLFSQWNWKHPQDSWTTALLVAATFVQTLWPWRPEVAVTGPSDCGKSTLMNTLKGLFGGLEFYIQKPTEAGIRQMLGNRAAAILVDEFENDGGRQKVLELFRTSSSGGKVIRGSSDQKGRTFEIRHIPWMAAIESGLTKAADRNRFIILDLNSLARSKRGNVMLPTAEELQSLGFRLMAIALRHVDRAIAMFYDLRKITFDGVHGRVVESFSVPASLRACVEESDAPGAAMILGELLQDRVSIAKQGGGDESDLLTAILESQFPIGGGSPPATVSSVISDADMFVKHYLTLEQNGVAMTEGRPGPRRITLEGKNNIFIRTDTVRRFLLKATPWFHLDCEQLLMRLPGAMRVQRSLMGGRHYGVEIPITDWIERREKSQSVLDLLAFEDPATDGQVASAADGDASGPSPEEQLRNLT